MESCLDALLICVTSGAMWVLISPFSHASLTGSGAFSANCLALMYWRSLMPTASAAFWETFIAGGSTGVIGWCKFALSDFAHVFPVCFPVFLPPFPGYSVLCCLGRNSGRPCPFPECRFRGVSDEGKAEGCPICFFGGHVHLLSPAG